MTGLRHAPAVIAIGLAGCGVDVVLGDADPAGRGLAAGAYQLRHGDLVEVECFGALEGREASFVRLLASDVGLADGRIDLTSQGGGVVVTGTPIRAAFGRPALALTLGAVPGEPDDALVAAAPIERDGIEGTRALLGTLALSVAEATTRHVDGWAKVSYSSAASETDVHACVLTFAVALEACCR